MKALECAKVIAIMTVFSADMMNNSSQSKTTLSMLVVPTHQQAEHAMTLTGMERHRIFQLITPSTKREDIALPTRNAADFPWVSSEIQRM